MTSTCLVLRLLHVEYDVLSFDPVQSAKVQVDPAQIAEGKMASKITYLYLTGKEVVEAGLTMAEVTELCTESLRAHGLKEVENPPKPGIHPLPDAFIHAMPGQFARLLS